MRLTQEQHRAVIARAREILDKFPDDVAHPAMKSYEGNLADLSYTAWTMLDNDRFAGWLGTVRCIFMLGYEAGREAEREKLDGEIWTFSPEGKAP